MNHNPPVRGKSGIVPISLRHPPAFLAVYPPIKRTPCPPLSSREPETRSLTGAFFLLINMGLGEPSGFRRLASGLKSVSERPASLSTRPPPRLGWIQNVTPFQVVVENGLRCWCRRSKCPSGSTSTAMRALDRAPVLIVANWVDGRFALNQLA